MASYSFLAGPLDSGQPGCYVLGISVSSSSVKSTGVGVGTGALGPWLVSHHTPCLRRCSRMPERAQRDIGIAYV
jgi:hypothetical protein